MIDICTDNDVISAYPSFFDDNEEFDNITSGHQDVNQKNTDMSMSDVVWKIVLIAEDGVYCLEDNVKDIDLDGRLDYWNHLYPDGYVTFNIE